MLLRNLFISGLKISSFHLQKFTISPNSITGARYLSTELAAALRPFYFVVHPDLFGQYPEQRSVNEDSLKQLSAHLQMLYEGKPNILREKKTLQFYIREENVEERNKFKLIKITLDYRSNDPKRIIQELLELCNLSTDYIKGVKYTNVKIDKAQSSNGVGFKPSQDYSYGPEFAGFEYAYYKVSKSFLSISWTLWISKFDFVQTKEFIVKF